MVWLLVCLVLAGCDDPPETPAGIQVTEEAAPAQPVDPVPAAQVEKKAVPKAAAPEPEKPRKRLDLSLPPQPPVAPRARDDKARVDEPILPDLFELRQKAEKEHGAKVKGRMLMEPGIDERLDRVEGAQIIIEKKTR